jgi:hypothetical protein
MTDTEFEVVNSSHDWRYSAYLKRVNWPECIPEMGPKREHGPFPWADPSHDKINDKVDSYSMGHPAAGSVGYQYLGDVCPYCGVPIHMEEEVYRHDGEHGELGEITELDTPVPCYHVDCWHDRRDELNQNLTEWTE